MSKRYEWQGTSFIIYGSKFRNEFIKRAATVEFTEFAEVASTAGMYTFQTDAKYCKEINLLLRER